MDDGVATSKSLFIISPIKKRGTKEHDFYDKVRRHIIVPAAEEMGYKALRADEIRRPGRITAQVITRLIDDVLVIADISAGNPNVFYELAIRHAVKKPVILMGQNTDQIPFDIRDQRIIFYSLDPDDIESAKHDIISQIKEIESKSFRMDSPITDVINIDFSDNPSTETELLQRLIEKLDSHSFQLSSLESSIMQVREGGTYRRPILTSRPIILDPEVDRLYRELERIGIRIILRSPSEVPDLPDGPFIDVSPMKFRELAEENMSHNIPYVNLDVDVGIFWLWVKEGDETRKYFISS